ncbi:DNA ligase [Gallibacterium salpingitidis]|uniref:DNA ligase n=1 Tax=Gallibacterium salpingitidis TaxID=505341 RepID=A0A1A7NRP0_9PAST|nr:DNA ligase [Gallibacterium salpingitidis]OBW91674.1 DNA ligase [Gallibacterium salpingitidis]
MRYCYYLLCYFIAITTVMAKDTMMLLQEYRDQDVAGWVMSEKLDGVRGYWTGKQLLTRQDNPLHPPAYFIEQFPPFAIDGELFSERGKFEEISSITRSSGDKGWHKLKLYVFDVPQAEGNLFQRLQVLQDYLTTHPSPYIEIITQLPIKHKQDIEQFLDQVDKLGGEGIVVRNPNARYVVGRSSQILKLKRYQDEECTVIAHHKGKGQFHNVMGSLTCENHRGTFKIGSGFLLADRANPPAIGSVITYKYRGETAKGKPKFATYWRQRSVSSAVTN